MDFNMGLGANSLYSSFELMLDLEGILFPTH